MRISGTKEWATDSVNVATGCSHGCLYCYARDMAVRYGRSTHETWTRESLRPVPSRFRKYGGTVMLPTTHDITSVTCASVVAAALGLLKAGNKILLVSKPHSEIISYVCSALNKWKDQVLFRFSIGAVDDRILGFWEPNAPSFSERLLSLVLAHERGYQTSVSAEPLLDSSRVCDLVSAVEPYVTDSIWIGKANMLRRRARWAVDPTSPELKRVEGGQTDVAIKAVYQSLRNNPLIRWKESYKAVLGLELATRAGLDR